MAGVRRVLFSSVFALLASPLLASPAFAAPLEAYGKLPSVESMAISPDGVRLAMVTTDGEKRTISVQNLAQHKVERVLAAGDAKLRGLMWADPDHLVVLRSTTAEITGFTTAHSEFVMGFEYDMVSGTAHAIMDKTVDAPNSFGEPEVPDVV